MRFSAENSHLVVVFLQSDSITGVKVRRVIWITGSSSHLMGLFAQTRSVEAQKLYKHLRAVPGCLFTTTTITKVRRASGHKDVLLGRAPAFPPEMMEDARRVAPSPFLIIKFSCTAKSCICFVSVTTDLVCTRLTGFNQITAFLIFRDKSSSCYKNTLS